MEILLTAANYESARKLKDATVAHFEVLFGIVQAVQMLGYGPDGRGNGVRFQSGYENFMFPTASRPALGLTDLPIEWVTGAASPGVKRQGRDADHFHPSSAEFKNGGGIPPLPIHLHRVMFN
jgi:hypothetical protein